MPELPEVETIVRSLQGGGDHTALPGKVIEDVRVFWQKTVEVPPVDEFIQRLKGQRVVSVGRRGKFILISFDTDFLLIHLRMSGDLRLEEGNRQKENILPFQKHDRIVLDFNDERRLVFNDPRKFGRVWLVKDAGEVTHSLGPEPLDSSLSSHFFYELLQSHKRQIKPLLMDQTFLAGMGNIYTDEALHMAKIHPCIPADIINRKQADDLLQSIRSVLQEGIRRNGASIDWVYRGGDFQNSFKVYQRTGFPCMTCGTTIQRIVVGQRGTHFCPHCQPGSKAERISKI